MTSRTARLAALLAVAVAACGGKPTLVITNVQVIDGTGASARVADVRISGDRIVEIGDLTVGPGETSLDARGLSLVPGFIDTHSHHDRGLADLRDALAAVSQGITTIVVGQDGGSRFPLDEFFDRVEGYGVAVNVASYAGHNTIRRRVMGDDFRRTATASEVDSMKQLLRRELENGALGLSTGLEYDPGIYSTTEEVVQLAEVAAEYGARYISHMRSEDRALWDAVEETIRIGREAELPVQISHMKLAMRSLWGQAGRLLARLDAARDSGIDISADVYPYEYWQSTMTVLFPERNFTDRAAATFALEELAPPEGILIAQFGPDTSYVGKTMAEIAALRGTDPATTYMALIAESQAWQDSTGRGGESIIARSMTWDDITRLYRWPHTNVSSDGGLRGRHPRGFGSFTRVLGRLVREEGVLTWEQAVHRMTGLAAEHAGISDRGVIRPNAYADLVLLDPDRVIDRATPENPNAVSEGIVRVWVNGVAVYEEGATTGEFPGRVIRRAGGESGE